MPVHYPVAQPRCHWRAQRQCLPQRHHRSWSRWSSSLKIYVYYLLFCCIVAMMFHFAAGPLLTIELCYSIGSSCPVTDSCYWSSEIVLVLSFVCFRQLTSIGSDQRQRLSDLTHRLFEWAACSFSDPCLYTTLTVLMTVCFSWHSDYCLKGLLVQMMDSLSSIVKHPARSSSLFEVCWCLQSYWCDSEALLSCLLNLLSFTSTIEQQINLLGYHLHSTSLVVGPFNRYWQVSWQSQTSSFSYSLCSASSWASI